MTTSLFFPFWLSLSFALFERALFSSFYVLAFAPFLALVLMRKPLITSLWLGLACGSLIDLLSSEHYFAFHALSYCLTTLCLYAQRRHFFDDKATSLSLFTALFAFVSTIIEWLLTYTFEQFPSLTWQLIASDLICMPLFDALYAFIWFTCPIRAYVHLRSINWKALLVNFRRKNESNE